MTTTVTGAGQLLEYIEQGDWLAVRAHLGQFEAPDIADMLLELPLRERTLALRLLPRDRASDVVAHFEPDQVKEIVSALSDKELSRLLATLRPDDRTGVLEELPGQMTQRLLNLLPPEDLAEARQLLGYPEDSVGRLMTPDYVAVRPEWTVAAALEHVRRATRRSETIHAIYVVDKHWMLLDAIDLRRLILANPEAEVESLMDRSFLSISATADQEEAVALMRRYDLYALPVTDQAGTLVGIVTVDDILQVAEEEATEDFHKVGGMSPLETSYTSSTLAMLYRKRAGWLLSLVLINIASSGVIAAFEDTLSATIALAFFIPLLIDSGGNAGSQAATLMVRALATGDVTLRSWLPVMWKELRVGLVLGATMAVAAGLLGFYRGQFDLAIVVGLSMITVVVIANLIGTLLPLVLTRLRVDPAVASSPLITTIADTTGLLIYFSFAVLILGGS